jgi:MYXO-CTERM domain-containing protein
MTAPESSSPESAAQETAAQHTANGTPDIDQLQSQIEQTREELAETVDALGAKLDVKSRAKAKVSSTTEQARAGVQVGRDRVVTVTSRAVNAATDDNGRPTPPVIVTVSAAAVTALLVTGLVVWRRRR